ncbi:DDI1 homolog 2 [Trichuris trichiura]|uniref:DDI1 homolog 2 n=1 Tax=Trichuris trichiura TaxID=36087 RepID=A0A077YX09_TRITR|nr:DDI1 homolog 2 [Trichuris trichiura]
MPKLANQSWRSSVRPKRYGIRKSEEDMQKNQELLASQRSITIRLAKFDMRMKARYFKRDEQWVRPHSSLVAKIAYISDEQDTKIAVECDDQRGEDGSIQQQLKTREICIRLSIHIVSVDDEIDCSERVVCTRFQIKMSESVSSDSVMTESTAATELQLTIVVNGEEIFPVVAQRSMTVKALTDHCKQYSATLNEHGFSVGVSFNGQFLTDHSRTLGDCGVKNGDALSFHVVPTEDLEAINVVQQISNDPNAAAAIISSNPELLEAITRRDLAKVKQLLPAAVQSARNAPGRAEKMRNPTDPDVQKLIEENIRLENIDSMFVHAMEHMPETFGSVSMLFIRCKVNNFDTTAFVDSGAQATIISEDFAERCGLMRLIDRRFSGVAMGVGTCKILGRVHIAQLQIENVFLAVSCMVVEKQPMDILFGLDMLKRHQCVIDLKENCLIVGEARTPFLAEHEMPAICRQVQDQAGPSIRLRLDGANFAEEDIRKVTRCGFTVAQAIEGLKYSNGDVKKAIAWLVVRNLDKP